MDIFEKIALENKRAEAKSKKPTKVEIEKEAAFLKKWSKGKPIVRQADDSTFWAAGKWMTKLTFKMAEGIAAAGLAKLEGDAKARGARLQF